MSHRHPNKQPSAADRVSERAGRRATAAWQRTRDVVAPTAAVSRAVTGAVTALGWCVLAGGVVGWLAGYLLGWVELITVAAACLITFAVACIFAIGRTRLAVTLDVNPARVVAGNSAVGRVTVRNVARWRLLPTILEVPIGIGSARFNMPSLAPTAVHEELFVVSTTRRGVIDVGPATTVRGDPIGLIQRTSPWTPVVELFVHPITVPLEPLGAGLLRDLEGTTTNETSMSDLAFHTLRDYAPGDDRRYIHWRSSAKAASISENGKFLVRQFLDTRRSHITLIIDGQPTSYLDPVDFETAISAAASVAVRAIGDDMNTTVLVAEHAVHEANIQRTLDTFSRATAGGGSLGAMAAQAVRMAPDTSVAVIVTGARTSFADLQRAASHFAVEVNIVAIRIDPTSGVGFANLAGLSVLTLPELSGLGGVLAGAGI